MTKFDIIPLSDALGAEIRGLDLREKLDAETISAVEQAWYDHIVLAFRDQDLTIEQQRAFASQLGSLAPRGGEGGTKHEQAISENVMLVTNIRENGKPIGTLPDGEMMFHSDGAYAKRPFRYTLLYALEVPSVGGNTQFANMYNAYDTLPETLKTKLKGCHAEHLYYANNRADAPDRSLSGVRQHPIFIEHEETGRTALYISRLMTAKIVGLADDESEAILAELLDHTEKPEFVYEHVWTPGDFVVWDNRCLNHARTDFAEGERRLLRRTTVFGVDPVAAASQAA